MNLYLNKAVINIHICIFPAPLCSPLPACTGSDYNVEPQLPWLLAASRSKGQQACRDTPGPFERCQAFLGLATALCLPLDHSCPRPGPRPLGVAGVAWAASFTVAILKGVCEDGCQ